MGNFEEHRESHGGSRGRSGGSRFGGRSSGGFGGRSGGGFRGRDSGRPMQKYDAICSKCSKECQLPFRPTGRKPVLCSDCFRQSGNAPDSPRGAPSGASSEQMSQINAKLDKIIKILQDLEIDTSGIEGEESGTDDEETAEDEEKAEDSEEKSEK